MLRCGRTTFGSERAGRAGRGAPGHPGRSGARPIAGDDSRFGCGFVVRLEPEFAESGRLRPRHAPPGAGVVECGLRCGIGVVLLGRGVTCAAARGVRVRGLVLAGEAPRGVCRPGESLFSSRWKSGTKSPKPSPALTRSQIAASRRTNWSVFGQRRKASFENKRHGWPFRSASTSNAPKRG